MTAPDVPFTDQALVRGPLYASADRLARRTSALHRARVAGRHAGEVIADLAEAALAPGGSRARVADIGCGRGTTTRMLAQRIPGAAVPGLDLSAALLAAARERQPEALAVRFVRADFCHLPLADQSCHVMVAAFCLYHCAVPGQVIGEIGRCLRPGGTAILVTKSADSYRELDELLAAAGLDPGALSRPGLYDTAHSGNLPALASAHLSVQRVMHHAHRFTFSGLADAAKYLATSPKYRLPAAVAGDPAAITGALRARLRDGPVTTTSTVSYVVAERPADTRRVPEALP
jgi:ubiquinone/menaquinone biosynthesis C-methylase UbiE